MASAHAARINGPSASGSREQRLALLEALFVCDSPRAVAELGVDWLVHNAVGRELVIALVEREHGRAARLVGLAGHGVRTGSATVALDDPEHPLAQVVRGGEPADLATGTFGLGATRCIAYPLPWPARGDADAVGVLVLGGASREATLRWAVRFLGRKLVEVAPRSRGGIQQRLTGQRALLRVAEMAVRAERDRLDLILSSVADPIIVTDPNGGTVMTNAPAARLFTAPAGSSTEEMQRVRANDARFSAHVANLFGLEPGGRFHGQVSLLDPKTAAPVPVEAVSGKLVSRQGEVTAIVTILHDRTEALEKSALYEELKSASSALEDKVREATAELLRQNKVLHRQAIELEAASSAKSLFLANMSHELRTPLNAILGYTSMLLQGVSGPLPPKLTRPLTRIDSNGQHLLTIINDILDIARIEAGKMPYNPTKFVVADLVKEVLAELEPLIVRSKLRVRSEVGKVVPIMNTDRAKVKQILVNLVSNALKFTPEGAVTVSAQFHKRTSETWISVADTGIGIADADRDVVFEDFRQVDNSPTRPYGGTGLGLAICRRLANVLGGEMRLASKIDKGSTFTLVLPARHRPPASAPPSQKASAR